MDAALPFTVHRKKLLEKLFRKVALWREIAYMLDDISGVLESDMVLHHRWLLNENSCQFQVFKKSHLYPWRGIEIRIFFKLYQIWVCPNNCRIFINQLSPGSAFFSLSVLYFVLILESDRVTGAFPFWNWIWTESRNIPKNELVL